MFHAPFLLHIWQGNMSSLSCHDQGILCLHCDTKLHDLQHEKLLYYGSTNHEKAQ